MTQTSLGLSDTEFLEKDPAELLAETDEKPTDQEIESSDQTDEDKVVTSEEEVSEAQEQTEDKTVKEEVSQPEGDTQTEPEPFADSGTTVSLDTSKIDSTETRGILRKLQSLITKVLIKKCLNLSRPMALICRLRVLRILSV